MPSGVSIVICCHNSARRLPPTLEHLAAQQLHAPVVWEVIVVDNASTDDTAAAAAAAWPGSAPAPLRVVPEPRPGLTHARERGLLEARHEIISLIDDDNWVCPAWVSLVAEIMRAHPEAAACGGANEAVCEVEPPAWFGRYQRSYAVGTQEDAPGAGARMPEALWGAGMNLRRAAWQRLRDAGFRPLLTDRQGAALTSGGDMELSYALRLAGWQLRYDPRLRLQHFLPAGRLQWAYLRRLYAGFGASTAGLDPYYFALNLPHPSYRGRLRQTWQCQVVLALQRLLRHRSKLRLVAHPDLEGDPDVLEIERLKARLAGLLRRRATYARDLRAVRHAPWRDIAPPCRASTTLPESVADRIGAM